MSTATRKPISASTAVEGNPLIESDRVDGTAVYGSNEKNLGSIKRLMIDKVSGKVAYTVMAFDTFLGLGGKEYAIPWSKLTYDTALGGFRTDITEEQLSGAPDIYDDNREFKDRRREQELHDYWRVPYYWGM